MYVAQETTDWGAESCSNNIYVFEKKPEGRTGKCIAYIKQGSDRVEKFKKPYTLDLRGRTFVEVK